MPSLDGTTIAIAIAVLFFLPDATNELKYEIEI